MIKIFPTKQANNLSVRRQPMRVQTAHYSATIVNQNSQIANRLLQQNQYAITAIVLLTALNLAQYFTGRRGSDETFKNALDDCQSEMAKCIHSKPFSFTNAVDSENHLNDTLITEFLNPAPSPFPLGSQERFDAFVIKKQALDEECKAFGICT